MCIKFLAPKSVRVKFLTNFMSVSTLLPRCHLSKYHTQQTVQKTSAQFNRVLLLLSELSIIQSPVLLLDLGQVWVWPEETWKIYRQLPASEIFTFDLQEIRSCPSDAMAHPLWSSRVTWQRRKIVQGYHVIHSLASTVRILSICSLGLWLRQWKSLEGWMCW